MSKYVIEKEIPGAGKLTAEQLKGISQTSCGVTSNIRSTFDIPSIDYSIDLIIEDFDIY